MTKVWMITGASRGIGLEIAKAVLDAGYRVVATGRTPEAFAGHLSPCDELIVLPLDVTDPAASHDAVAAARDRFGRIDVLLNNAGYGLFGAVEECSPEEVQAQFATNVFGLLNVTRAVLPLMRAQRSGHVMNVSSMAGFLSRPGISSYAASKFAVEAISESLVGELAPFGIKVTVLEPGPFRTDFLAGNSAVVSAGTIAAYDEVMREFRGGAIKRDGTQKGDPRKLARAVLTIVEAEDPPFRFTAGADAVRLHEKVLADRREALEAWRGLATALDFD